MELKVKTKQEKDMIEVVKEDLGDFLVEVLLVVARTNRLSPKAHNPIQAYMSKFRPQSQKYIKKCFRILKIKNCLYQKGDSYGLTKLGFVICLREAERRRH